MKKFMIALILLTLSLSFALAEDPDSVVGTYYLFYDKSATPEMATSFGAYDRMIAVYSFLSDGSIVCLEHDVLDGSGTPFFGSAGKWEPNGQNYKYNIIGFGSGELKLYDDYVMIQINETTTYMKLRKLIPMDPYHDYAVNP